MEVVGHLAIHAGEEIPTACQCWAEWPEALNEGWVLSGAIHCAMSQVAPPSKVCPTQPLEPAKRTCSGPNTSRVRTEHGRSLWTTSGSGDWQLAQARATRSESIKLRIA